MEKVYFKKRAFSLLLFILLSSAYFLILFLVSGQFGFKMFFGSFVILIPIWIYYIRIYEKIRTVFSISDKGINISRSNTECFISWDNLKVDSNLKRSGFTFAKAIQIKSDIDPQFSDLLAFDYFEGDSLKFLIKKYTPKDHELYRLMSELYPNEFSF